MPRGWTAEEAAICACLSVFGIQNETQKQLLRTYCGSERSRSAVRLKNNELRNDAEAEGIYNPQTKEYHVGRLRDWISSLDISDKIATACNQILDTQEELCRILSSINYGSRNDADYSADDRTNHYGNYGHEHATINNLETNNYTVPLTPGFFTPPGLYRGGFLYPIGEDDYYRNTTESQHPI